MTAWKNFMLFKEFVGVHWKSLRGAERTIMFVVFLATVRKLAYSSIVANLAGIRYWQGVNGINDSSVKNGKNIRQLELLLRGIKRSAPERRRLSRLPVTRPLLESLLRLAECLGLQELEACRLRAALLLGFWGFFRSEAYCSVRGRPSTLRRGDVSRCWLKDGSIFLVLRLRKSKARQFKEDTVYLHSVSGGHCPVVEVVRFLDISASLSGLSGSSQLLEIPGNPLSVKVLNGLLRALVLRAGLDPQRFSSHSLRAGAATHAANAGVSPLLIQKLGRWSSGCFANYVRDPKPAIKAAQGKMARKGGDI